MSKDYDDDVSYSDLGAFSVPVSSNTIDSDPTRGLARGGARKPERPLERGGRCRAEEPLSGLDRGHKWQPRPAAQGRSSERCSRGLGRSSRAG
mgnify:CR=1 FL=1